MIISIEFPKRIPSALVLLPNVF